MEESTVKWPFCDSVLRSAVFNFTAVGVYLELR